MLNVYSFTFLANKKKILCLAIALLYFVILGEYGPHDGLSFCFVSVNVLQQ